MSKADITQKELKRLLDYDPSTGILTWKISNSCRVGKGDIAGSRNDEQYIVVKVNCIAYRAHRIIWRWFYGVWPNGEIDHINHIRYDNRIVNLRDVIHRENGRNKTRHSNNTSGSTGVVYRNGKNIKKRWHAYIGSIPQKHLGCYKNKAEAVAARKRAEVELGFHENHG